MNARTIGLLATVLALSAGTVAPSWAQGQSDTPRPAVAASNSTPIGKVVTVTGAVSIMHGEAVVVQAALGGGGRTKVGDAVYRGDVVQTGADGSVGVTFSDGTAFNLRSNARMVLNEFVYDPNGKSNSTLFSLSKGTFTFVAGKVAKTGNMKIDTPVATMGIRGTTPHVEISDDGKVSFTTLIEDDKNGAGQKRAGVTPVKRQRQTKSAAPPDTTVAQPLPRSLDVNLKICRNC